MGAESHPAVGDIVGPEVSYTCRRCDRLAEVEAELERLRSVNGVLLERVVAAVRLLTDAAGVELHGIADAGGGSTQSAPAGGTEATAMVEAEPGAPTPFAWVGHPDGPDPYDLLLAGRLEGYLNAGPGGPGAEKAG